SIGIHSGPVVAGTIGAADRHEYTVVGDTVNVAARLQELCRDHHHGLLVSGATHELATRTGSCGDVVARYALRPPGRDAAVDALPLSCWWVWTPRVAGVLSASRTSSACRPVPVLAGARFSCVRAVLTVMPSSSAASSRRWPWTSHMTRSASARVTPR